MALAEEILDQTHAYSHFVQLYEADERALIENVGKYLSDGIVEGAALLVVVTGEHRAAFSAELASCGTDIDRLERAGQLVWRDSPSTLTRIMVNGHPDAERFDADIGADVRSAIAGVRTNRLRAYGDMVGVLWKERQYPAAIRLEQLWNRLRKKTPFSLLCAYPVDVFGDEFEAGILDALLCAHTHLLPAGTNGRLDAALRRAIDEVLGADERRSFARIDSRQAAWAKIPKAEAAILWLRNNVPQRADQILGLARAYYAAPPSTI